MNSINNWRAALGEGDWPIVNKQDENDGVVSLSLWVPESLTVFDGHFPGQAVLPGILQVHWAAEFGRLLFSDACSPSETASFKSLRGIKFNSMITPGAEVSLNLEFNHDAGKLKFEYFSLEQKYSNGTVEYLQVQT